MPKIVIDGLPPYDGSYDLDVSRFNGRELHTIKEISGVRAGELQAAFEAGDYDLVVALTVIMLRRDGKTVDPDAIMDADLGSITVDVSEDIDTAEDEERPPDRATPGGGKNETAGVANGNEHTNSSGSPSSSDGDPPPLPLTPIGSRS